MIGAIFQFIAGNLLDDNIEELLKVVNKGGNFEFDTGIIGKQIEKLTKGKIKANLGITGAFKGVSNATGMKRLMLHGVGGVSKLMFHPAGIAARMIAGEIYNRQSDAMDFEANKQVLKMPDESAKYLINEDFRALSANTTHGMEMVNYTVNQLLNSGNLAGNMIDRVFENM